MENIKWLTRVKINEFIIYLGNIIFTLVRKNKFDVVDFQNATLSGGVAVGAIADLMIQPGGAFIAGSLCGVVSTLGYRVIQVIVVS